MPGGMRYFWLAGFAMEHPPSPGPDGTGSRAALLRVWALCGATGW
ncbi:MAG TPA: hypothetical protein VGF67_21660 [Ktedonobacteraceae bacterium]